MGTETRGECSPTTLTGEGVPRLTRRGRESATNALVLDCSFSRFRPKTEGKARSRREPPKERELRLPAIAYPKQSRMVDGPAPAFFSGVAVLVATLLFFFWEISALEHVMLRFPLAGILLPVSGIGALALVLPIFVFLCFRNDFLNTNIIFPKHYFYVFRRTYASVLNNNGKVSKKTL